MPSDGSSSRNQVQSSNHDSSQEQANNPNSNQSCSPQAAAAQVEYVELQEDHGDSENDSQREQAAHLQFGIQEEDAAQQAPQPFNEQPQPQLEEIKQAEGVDENPLAAYDNVAVQEEMGEAHEQEPIPVDANQAMQVADIQEADGEEQPHLVQLSELSFDS